jgi:hypothetical protein
MSRREPATAFWRQEAKMARTVAVLGTNHKIQRCAKMPESLEDPDYETLLRQLLSTYKVDFIFEEAQALGPTLGEKVAVEKLGPDRYEDVDPAKSAWESLGIVETCKGYFIGEPDLKNQVWPHAVEQIMAAHDKREQMWLQSILDRSDFENALMICGDHHLFSFSFRLIQMSFDVRAFSYMPIIYEGHILLPKIQKTTRNV